jgi:uncharacterized SAM-binding protein YcdF (DUF218 family)
MVTLLLWCLFGLYPFLAVTQRVSANTLVVEGWVHRYGIRAAVAEFKNGPYQYAFSTGGPVTGNGGYVNDFQTSASVGAELLKKDGIPLESLEMVPSHVIGRDRTYSSAVALREWLREHNADVRSFNVVTEDTHARRTRLLFQEAFGESVKVGIIAVPNPDYDARHWWRYSEGVRDVISESVAYLYAKFFFWPGAAEPREKGDRRSQIGDRSWEMADFSLSEFGTRSLPFPSLHSAFEQWIVPFQTRKTSKVGVCRLQDQAALDRQCREMRIGG